MIGSLRGAVIDRVPSIEKASAQVLLEVAGVGYRLTITSATLEALPTSGEAFLYVHHHFWEADQKLFGFASVEERDAFEGLLTAHKVGPALALAVLSTYSPVRLAQVLADDDVDALCEVPGVGKKTAQRLIVDLKSVLVLPVLEADDGATLDLTGGKVGLEPSAIADVREALDSLGYSQDEIRNALAGIDPAERDTAESGDLLKQALRVLAGG